MEIGNVAEAATLKSFLYEGYKKHASTFFVTVFFYFHDTNISR